jgi:predicted nucleic acid-binding protein
MSARKAFVDSNILVYAHDSSQSEKHASAKALVRKLWEQRSGALSTQVLQEFYVNIRRKVKRPLPPEEAREALEDYLRWHVVVNDGDAIRAALDLEQRYQLSFWDSLIVNAARSAGAAVLYSEDLNHGQSYGSVTVINPFIEPAS